MEPSGLQHQISSSVGSGDVGEQGIDNVTVTISFSYGPICTEPLGSIDASQSDGTSKVIDLRSTMVVWDESLETVKVKSSVLPHGEGLSGSSVGVSAGVGDGVGHGIGICTVTVITISLWGPICTEPLGFVVTFQSDGTSKVIKPRSTVTV